MAALTVIAGCLGGGDGAGDSGGGGGDGNGEPTSTPTPRATASPTPTATTTPTTGTTDERTPTTGTTGEPTPTAEPTATGTPTTTPTPTPEADQTVTVGPDGRLVFEPETFEVAVGGTVRWEWASAGHNVSPERQPSDASWPGDDESTYPAGRTYAYTFAVAGQYEYHCDPHQSVGMRGSFTVR